jgi:hypothetical protein
MQTPLRKGMVGSGVLLLTVSNRQARILSLVLFVDYDTADCAPRVSENVHIFCQTLTDWHRIEAIYAFCVVLSLGGESHFGFGSHHTPPAVSGGVMTAGEF